MCITIKSMQSSDRNELNVPRDAKINLMNCAVYIIFYYMT